MTPLTQVGDRISTFSVVLISPIKDCCPVNRAASSQLIDNAASPHVSDRMAMTNADCALILLHPPDLSIRRNTRIASRSLPAQPYKSTNPLTQNTAASKTVCPYPVAPDPILIPRGNAPEKLTHSHTHTKTGRDTHTRIHPPCSSHPPRSRWPYPPASVRLDAAIRFPSALHSANTAPSSSLFVHSGPLLQRLRDPATNVTRSPSGHQAVAAAVAQDISPRPVPEDDDRVGRRDHCRGGR